STAPSRTARSRAKGVSSSDATSAGKKLSHMGFIRDFRRSIGLEPSRQSPATDVAVAHPQRRLQKSLSANICAIRNLISNSLIFQRQHQVPRPPVRRQAVREIGVNK